MKRTDGESSAPAAPLPSLREPRIPQGNAGSWGVSGAFLYTLQNLWIRQTQRICLLPFSSGFGGFLRLRKVGESEGALSEPEPSPKSGHLKGFPVHLGQTPRSLLWPPRSFELWPPPAFPASSHVNLFFSSHSSRAELLIELPTVMKIFHTCAVQHSSH